MSARPEDQVPTNYLHVFLNSVRAWISLQNMLIARQAHAMQAHDDKLLVFGGYTNDPHNSMHLVDCLQNEMYDISAGQWTLLRDITDVDGHLHNAVTMFDDKIFILGGPSARSGRYLHSYDPEKDSMHVEEYCGQSVQQLVTLGVSLPPECIPSLTEDANGAGSANEDETDSDDVTVASARR